jgi:hypothetical protein
MGDETMKQFLIKAFTNDENIDGGYAIIEMTEETLLKMKQMHSALIDLKAKIVDIIDISALGYSAVFIDYTEKLDDMGLIDRVDEGMVEIVPPIEIPEISDNKIQWVETEFDKMIVSITGLMYFQGNLEDSSVELMTQTIEISEWEKLMK